MSCVVIFKVAPYLCMFSHYLWYPSRHSVCVTVCCDVGRNLQVYATGCVPVWLPAFTSSCSAFLVCFLLLSSSHCWNVGVQLFHVFICLCLHVYCCFSLFLFLSVCKHMQLFDLVCHSLSYEPVTIDFYKGDSPRCISPFHFSPVIIHNILFLEARCLIVC